MFYREKPKNDLLYKHYYAMYYPELDILYVNYVNNNDFGIKLMNYDASNNEFIYDITDEQLWFLTKIRMGV